MWILSTSASSHTISARTAREAPRRGGDAGFWCIGVSLSNNPLNFWRTVRIASQPTRIVQRSGVEHTIPDYPGLGITADKVILTGHLLKINNLMVDFQPPGVAGSMRQYFLGAVERARRVLALPGHQAAVARPHPRSRLRRYPRRAEPGDAYKAIMNKCWNSAWCLKTFYFTLGDPWYFSTYPNCDVPLLKDTFMPKTRYYTIRDYIASHK